MVGPVLFAATLLALSVIEYHFMLEIGWRPLADPAGAWPSGLALGPYGWIQTANFILSGVLLMLFAAGLHLETKNARGSRTGSASLFVAGAAMALMGFDTDPIRRTRPVARPRPLHARDGGSRRALAPPARRGLLPIYRGGARLVRGHRAPPLATLRLAHLAHEERRDVHVGGARARADGILRHLEGLGHSVGALEAHALGGHRIAADEDDVAEVLEGVGCPVQDRERVHAVVGVGVAVERSVPRVAGVPLLVARGDLVQVGRLREHLVPQVYVARVVGLAELVRDGVGPPRLHARHPVRGLYALEDAPRGRARHRPRRLVAREEVRLRERAPVGLGLGHEVEERRI